MKVLVTGGAGYIGSHLVDYLIDKGHQVHVIDNLVSGKFENVNPRSELTIARIEGDHAYETVINKKFDIVFHLAAVSRTPWAIEKPDQAYKTNILGSANILEAARQSGVKKVVIASSNIVYAAQTPYKSSKLAMEMVARDYNDLYGLPTVCLRFSNVYGAVDGIPLRQHEDNVLATLRKTKQTEGKLKITGDGEQTRNFTHVLDICEALYKASQSDVQGTEIDIMNPTKWSLNEVAKFYDCPIEYIPDRKGDIKHLTMEIGPEKARELLGFEAKRELPDYIGVYTEV